MDHHPSIAITELGDNRRRIEVTAHDLYAPVRSCETEYPLSLIEPILETKGVEYLCDEICRDIDPGYVEADLKYDLNAYFTPEDLAGKRVLDFGCGSGASSMILSRMFPDSEIVGVELEQEYLKIARGRLEFYGYPNVTFFQSPSGDKLPSDLGEFDLVVMSAVYEHLLPAERTAVLPLVWSTIKPGGHLFLNMTPHRWFPVEHHTTGLPLLNYLPDSLALSYARQFSNRIDKSEPWEVLLRRGIRGATENEVLEFLKKSPGKAVLLEPSQQDLRDRIDLWFSRLGKGRHRLAKTVIKSGLKTLKTLTGTTLVPNLSLVINKRPRTPLASADS